MNYHQKSSPILRREVRKWVGRNNDFELRTKTKKLAGMFPPTMDSLSKKSTRISMGEAKSRKGSQVTAM